MLNFKLNGNLGKDPEFKQSADGKDYAMLRIASNHPGVDDTDWFNIAVFNPNTLAQLGSLRKGDKVNITGTGRMAEWTDSNGVEHRATNFVAGSVTPTTGAEPDDSATRQAQLDTAARSDSVSAGR
jgi:single-stranded DNA-binding protein